MLTLITAPQVLPFSVAFAIVLGLGVLELLGLLVSVSPGHLLDHLVPQHLLPHHAPDGDAGNLGAVLSWLHIGRVPVMVLLLLFLTAFAVSGFAFQWLVHASSGGFASPWLASAAAAVEAIIVVRLAGRGLARLVPGDESSAISDASLIGSEAFVTAAAALGSQSASQASVLDANGRKHFILVTHADGEAPALVDGGRVVITAKVGALYVVTPLP